MAERITAMASSVCLFVILISQAQIIVGQSEIRLHRKGSPVMVDGPGEVSLFIISPPEVVFDEEGGHVEKILQGDLKFLDGVIPLAQLQVSRSHGVVDLGEFRIEFQGFSIVP